jgi:hypothetical protein
MWIRFRFCDGVRKYPDEIWNVLLYYTTLITTEPIVASVRVDGIAEAGSRKRPADGRVGQATVRSVGYCHPTGNRAAHSKHAVASQALRRRRFAFALARATNGANTAEWFWPFISAVIEC